MVQRALQAVNFQRHSGPTEIDLKGTVLLPKAEGKAAVEVKNGYTKIDLNIRRYRRQLSLERSSSHTCSGPFLRTDAQPIWAR